MTDEEKKAIETLEIEGTENNYLEVKILLDLVEKQQKEIKKEKNRIMELAELLDKQENEIKFLKGELEIQEGRYISKDKIREKIEEARKISWHIPKLVIEYFEELLEEI